MWTYRCLVDGTEGMRETVEKNTEMEYLGKQFNEKKKEYLGENEVNVDEFYCIKVNLR